MSQLGILVIEPKGGRRVMGANLSKHISAIYWGNKPTINLDEGAMAEQTESSYITTGYRSPLGPYQRRVEESARGAHLILDHIFGDKKSYLDPTYTIWDSETAQKAQDMVLQSCWQGEGNPFTEIPAFLRTAGVDSKALALFTAESYLLRNIQMYAANLETIEFRIRGFLNSAYSPDQVEEVITGKKVSDLLSLTLYKGGVQSNFYPSMTFIWMAQLCLALANASRTDKLAEDPWLLKDFLDPVSKVAAEVYVRRGRETDQEPKTTLSREAQARPFLIAMFPNVFEPISGSGDKKKINNYLLQKLQLTDTGDIDKNLLEARRYIETSQDQDNLGLQELRDFLGTDTEHQRGDFVFGEDRVILFDGLKPLWGAKHSSTSNPVSSTAVETLPAQGLTMLHRLNQNQVVQKIHAPRGGKEGKNWVADTLAVLENRKQIIFYGPPGTGKTFIAQALVDSYEPEDPAEELPGSHFEIVQFHPSYTYEDFFEGYRPSTTSPEDKDSSQQSLSFTLKPGPLKRLADRACLEPTRPFFLVIDEINRGNIAKIFGELYFLLEYRDRAITLQYSDAAFSLPENLFIIGTMNTVDRSIATVDSAIRRRFAFVELSPRKEPTRGALARSGNSVGAQLQEELNSRLSDRGADLSVGPSYFFGLTTQESLQQVWDYDILPLLVDYFYGVKTPDQVESEYALNTFLTSGSDEEAELEDGDGANDAHGDTGE